MGTVFRAFDRTTGHTVALKVLAHGNPDRPRFAREVKHLAAMSDPRIVRLIANGHVADDQPYLVMEWVDGESLQHLLDSRGLTVAESVMVGEQIAGALGVLHAHGLVHRDVKPSNLMFEARDISRVKVIDFGIARSIAEGMGLTMTGMILGTPGYM